MLDVICSSDMLQGSLTYFTSDRFGKQNSALALNRGWTQVPTGIYFNTPEFTFSVWVYPQQIGSWSRVIDFGNGAQSDNIFLSLSNGNYLLPIFQIWSKPALIFSEQSSQNLTLNSWQFIAVTFNVTIARIYLNGTLTAELKQYYTLPTLNRTNCFIGKSNWNDGFSSSYLDDLRFYSKSFTQTELIQLMNQNSTSNK